MRLIRILAVMLALVPGSALSASLQTVDLSLSVRGFTRFNTDNIPVTGGVEASAQPDAFHPVYSFDITSNTTFRVSVSSGATAPGPHTWVLQNLIFESSPVPATQTGLSLIGGDASFVTRATFNDPPILSADPAIIISIDGVASGQAAFWDFQFSTTAAAVPVPAPLALMMLGLGALGLASRCALRNR